MLFTICALHDRNTTPCQANDKAKWATTETTNTKSLYTVHPARQPPRLALHTPENQHSASLCIAGNNSSNQDHGQDHGHGESNCDAQASSLGSLLQSPAVFCDKQIKKRPQFIKFSGMDRHAYNAVKTEQTKPVNLPVSVVHSPQITQCIRKNKLQNKTECIQCTRSVLGLQGTAQITHNAGCLAAEIPTTNVTGKYFKRMCFKNMSTRL